MLPSGNNAGVSVTAYQIDDVGFSPETTKVPLGAATVLSILPTVVVVHVVPD